MAFVKRGSLTIWITEEAIAAWQAPTTGKRGGQPIYSAIAIETSLALRLVSSSRRDRLGNGGHCSTTKSQPFQSKRQPHSGTNNATIAEHGGMSWKRSSGYNRRSLVETTMFRYKTVIGRRLHARILPNQRTEANVGCNVLNRMTGLGMPVSARIA